VITLVPFPRTVERFAGCVNIVEEWISTRSATGLHQALKFLAIGAAVSLAVILVALCLGERIKTMASLLVARKHSVPRVEDGSLSRPPRKAASQGR
jgi:hypothetical protein